MAGFTGGRELAYLAFPRADVCTAEGDYPFITLLTADGDEHVLVRVQCADVSFVYTLNRDLTLADARFTDNLLSRHVQLERRGLLRHSLSAEERTCLQQVARFPNGGERQRPYPLHAVGWLRIGTKGGAHGACDTGVPLLRRSSPLSRGLEPAVDQGH
jgi:hypothetical protein